MTELTNVNLSAPAGDTLELSVPLPLNFAMATGDVLRWHAYTATYANPYGAPIIAKDTGSHGGVALISPPSLAVMLLRADTLALLGNYYWEAKQIDMAGNYTTLASGILTVTLSQSIIPVDPPMAPPANPQPPSYPPWWWYTIGGSQPVYGWSLYWPRGYGS